MIPNIKQPTAKYPISVYIGKYPDAEWVFIEDFKGTYSEALELIGWYQAMIPRTGNWKNSFRIWDNRW